MKKILVLNVGGTFIKYGLIADGKLELVHLSCELDPSR